MSEMTAGQTLTSGLATTFAQWDIARRQLASGYVPAIKSGTSALNLSTGDSLGGLVIIGSLIVVGAYLLLRQ